MQCPRKGRVRGESTATRGPLRIFLGRYLNPRNGKRPQQRAASWPPPPPSAAAKPGKRHERLSAAGKTEPVVFPVTIYTSIFPYLRGTESYRKHRQS